VTISETTLQKAIADGLLTADLADRLRAVESADITPDDPEQLRFISGFGDFLVVIGIISFTAATGFLVGMVSPWAGGLMFALATWGVAEYFTRKRRMALASIVSALLFAFGSYLTALIALGAESLDERNVFGQSNTFLALGVSAISLIPYYARFRTPIVPAMFLGAIFLTGDTFFDKNPSDLGKIYTQYLAPIFGIIILVYATRLDYLNSDRRSIQSDIAFWLHLLAATLIVHPIMLWSSFEYGSVVNDEVKRALTYDNQAKIRLAITPIMIFIALLVNRRAILVSILFYIYVSIAKLTDIDTIHFGDSVGEYISILVVGSLILILSVGWHPIRQILLKIVPFRLRRLLPRSDARSYG
jgi:hypothetical protein